MVAEDKEERTLKDLIHLPWELNDQFPMNHKQLGFDGTPLDALAYFINKKRSSTESQVDLIVLISSDPHKWSWLSEQQEMKQGTRASCRVFGGPLCILSRHGKSDHSALAEKKN